MVTITRWYKLVHIVSLSPIKKVSNENMVCLCIQKSSYLIVVLSVDINLTYHTSGPEGIEPEIGIRAQHAELKSTCTTHSLRIHRHM